MVLLIILIKFVTRKNPEKPVEGTYYPSISGFVPDCRNKHKLRKSLIHSYCTSNAQGKVVGTWSGLYRFSKAEIERAINYGNSKVHLGSGSAGQVYQGVLPSGQLVAVKHIYKTAMSDSFTSEVERLSKIRHPNLACLLGCCIENGEQYLVYEYCSNGNLAQNLLSESQNFRSFGGGKKKKTPIAWCELSELVVRCTCAGSDRVLPWDKRVRILRDCALALRFLHTHPDGCIVHRDIKVSG